MKGAEIGGQTPPTERGRESGSRPERIDFTQPRYERLLRHARTWEPFIINHSNKFRDDPGDPIDHHTGEIYLPHRFIAPNTPATMEQAHFARMFYWDLVVPTRDLAESGNPEYLELAQDHISNFSYMIHRYGFIPNENDERFLNRSQSPFFTTMIFDTYHAMEKAGISYAKAWLDDAMTTAQIEYTYWMSEDRGRRTDRKSNNRPNPNLSLVCFSGDDVPGDRYSATAASGEDDNSGTAGRTSDFYHMTANFALWKYEKDFAEAARILGKNETDDFKGPEYWEAKAAKRKSEINEYLWDENEGFYFHYDFVHQKRNTGYYGLTAYLSMFVGFFDRNDPEDMRKIDRMMSHLDMFEERHGLTVAGRGVNPTAEQIAAVQKTMEEVGMDERWLPSIQELFSVKQWDRFMWANVLYKAVAGFMNYGQVEDAKRIMEKALNAYAAYYDMHETLPEKMKIDGEVPESGGTFLYPDQKGFAWTNATVSLFTRMLQGIYEEEDRRELPSAA